MIGMVVAVVVTIVAVAAGSGPSARSCSIGCSDDAVLVDTVPASASALTAILWASLF